MHELLTAVEIDPSEFDALGVMLVAPVECCAERTLSANDVGIADPVSFLSVAAKKGTSLAVETEPGAGLRSGPRWAQE
jgi:hypothetical protein